MTRIAFSTVACPNWSLARVATTASELGYDAVELRTFGFGPSDFVCDPATTDVAKIRNTFAERGVGICCLGTSLRFDDPITPPVIGRVITDTERAVREAKSLIDLAVQVECPMVRVFAHEALCGSHHKSIELIAERLKMVADHADKTGVTVVLENGGDFRTSHDLAEMLGAVGSPLLKAAYSAREATAAGEDPADGVRALGGRLAQYRVQHRYVEHGERATPGEMIGLTGIGALDASAFVVFDYDKAWIPSLPDAEQALRDAGAAMRAADTSGSRAVRV